MRTRAPYLMYHEIEQPGRPLCSTEPGYTRYVVREDDFVAQLERIADLGSRGVSVGQRLSSASPADSEVVLTFDDGCDSDVAIVAPLLEQRRWSATFYITTGFLGRPGFLTPARLRELVNRGFEIGCHGATHRYLSDLTTTELHDEIAGAKAALEQVIGEPVRHFSCPGGRWSQTVCEVARASGFESIATSEIGRGEGNRYRLPRLAITRDISLDRFTDLVMGRRVLRMRARAAGLQMAKRLFGNAAYEKLRDWALRAD